MKVHASTVVAVVASALLALTLGAGQGSAAGEASGAPATYIVLLDGEPLAEHSPVSGGAQLNARSAASRAYLSQLANEQSAALARVATAIGHAVEPRFTYNATLNGFALTLTPDEAQRVAALSGVSSVTQDYNLELKTDVGPQWIGAGGLWSGSAGGAATKGEGIVVGVVDTGINHDHPSFADPGGDGHSYSAYGVPSGPGYRGVCDPVTGLPFCNDKLIGVYDFTGTTPLDDNGHGSHTASTAAGNVLHASIVAPTMTLERDISGVAPHARIIAYKGCVTAGATGTCPVSGTSAAINAAVLDGVDVINFSIGGVSRNPWTDPNAISFLNARRAGVFLAVSAGNEGPGAATVGSPADSPWVTAVGAATHNRLFSNSLTNLSGGASAPPSTLVGKGITTPYGPAPLFYDTAAPLCGSGPAEAATSPWPAGHFHGEIVVCDRGTYGRVQKGQFVKAAGGGGMVLLNDELNGDSLVGDAHALPAVHLSYADGAVLKAWLASGSGHTATIGGLNTDESPSNGDVTASFSSRGPNPSVPGVVKPDVTAPGVDILAAFNTPAGSVGAPPEYNSISGTSMSGPHTAGAAALLRALHPGWSPDEVRSALITTGFNDPPGEGAEVHGVQKEDSSTAADPFDLGGGRVELRRATRAGLVLDVDPDAYTAADPASGGDPKTLNLASLGNDACVSSCTWTRVVKSSASSSVTWTTSASGASGLGLTVSPASFTLAPGGTQAISVTADASALGSAWAFGRVVLQPNVASVPAAGLPVAVRKAGGEPIVPRLTLHFHGNAAATGADHDAGHPDEGLCTGDGLGDILACGGPYLLESNVLSPSAPASWKGGPAQWAGTGANDRTVFDPSWIWCLRKDDPANPDEFQCPNTGGAARGTTTVEGPMTIEWWAQCALTCAAVNTSWHVRLWADGVLALATQVDAGAAPTGVPTKLTATVNVPRTTASHRFTLHLEPVFLIDQGVEFTISYDSTQPCGPTTTAPCDSVVHMPVVSEAGPNAPPDAVDDSATVERGESVAVPVLANDTDPDGDALTITSHTNGAHGTVTNDGAGTLTYTQNGGPTTADSFSYTVVDGRGGSDTATVNVTVTGPDLVVTDITAVGSSGGGNRNTVTATIANTGTSDAPATATEIVLDDTTTLGVAATPAIPADSTTTVSVPWDTRNLKGDHVLTATADDAGAAAETDEGNNAATRSVTVKGNKVQNGSFEQSSSGAAPDNWSSSGSTTYSQGGSDGERSASAGPGGSWRSDPITVQPGTEYGFSVDVAGAAATVTIQQLSATGAVLASLPVPVAASPVGAFQAVEGALTTVAGASQVRVVLAGSLAGTATFDDVWLWER